MNLRREDQVNRFFQTWLQTLKMQKRQSSWIVKDCLYWPSQENIKSAVQVNKSVEATRAHLQGQLRNKEAENNRLTVQLRVHTLTALRFNIIKGKIL